MTIPTFDLFYRTSEKILILKNQKTSLKILEEYKLQKVKFDLFFLYK